ncbi:MAG: M55 family metallopeptidase [Thermoprotei archaeon]
MGGKVYISADMEGITGVVSIEDVRAGRLNYERFRHLMTQDVNAAIEGVLEAGASEVLVNDSHGGMTNILLEELHPSATLISGVHKPLYMMEGLDPSYTCALFVGYHSMVGGRGVLSHTFSGASHVLLNGRPTSEGEVNAMIAGSMGVPVTMVSGDQYAVSELREVLGDIEGAIVKYAIDRYSARCLHPSVTRSIIKEAARRGYEKAKSIKPYTVRPPITFEFEFLQPSMAARAAYLPFVEQLNPRSVRITAQDPISAWRLFWSALLLGRSAEED